MRTVFIISSIVFLLILSGCSRTEEPPGYSPPSFTGLAYVQAKGGGHIVVLDMATGEIARIRTGIKDGSLLLSRKTDELLIFGKFDGLKRINLRDGSQSTPRRLTREICSATQFSAVEVLLTDPVKESLIRYILQDGELSTLTVLKPGECGLATMKKPDGTWIAITNSKDSSIRILRLEDLTIVRKIGNAGNSIHGAVFPPSENTIWVAEGNEYKNGIPYGVGFAKTEAVPGGINIVDTATGEIVDHIIVGGNVVQIRFSSDGKYAYVISSQMPEYDEATLSIIDFPKRRVIKNYALCKSCHIWKGVELKSGKAFVSSFVLDEKGSPAQIDKALEEPFFSSQRTGESLINPKTVD
jgi:hypothetical protein